MSPVALNYLRAAPYAYLRSALYAQNPIPIIIKERLDAVHKAQHVDTVYVS